MSKLKVGAQVLFFPVASDYEVSGTAKTGPWPAVITSVAQNGRVCNLKVFADADRNLWKTNVEEGTEPGDFMFEKPEPEGNGKKAAADSETE